MARYAWGVIVVTVLAVMGGYAWVAWNKGGPGDGLYSRHWEPDPAFGYWHPARFFESGERMTGEYEGPQCVACHASVTPGVVADWRASRHSHPDGREPIYCDTCHGNDHSRLRLPDPSVCGGCHTTQHAQFLDERRYGFPSHALAMERVMDAKHCGGGQGGREVP